ncbi:MAG: FMN-binding protein, partial [Gammaproteobacteria bacterium]|nr:FMN-binding protein [Gammaproteobacteria bacterium]
LFALLLWSTSRGQVLAQQEWQNLETPWLFEVFPEAVRFSSRQGQPPVIQAFGSERPGAEPIGYLFTTPDLPPEEIGFSGPIHMLVGMDREGNITGTRVLYYVESYKNFRGDFIGDSGFVFQFNGKSIDQDFRVGQDIDGMARATISSWAIARGVRNAARRVAESYLPDISYVEEANSALTALQSLEAQNWQDYLDNGFVKELVVPIEDESDLEFAIAYMGHYRLGELLIGATAYSNADRTASGIIEDGHMLLLAMSGNTVRLQQLRLGVMQDDVLYPNRRERVVFAGTANEGKIAGQAQHAIAMYIDAAVDISRPFSVIYDVGERTGEFSDYVVADYTLPTDVLSLVTGRPNEQIENDA